MSDEQKIILTDADLEALSQAADVRVEELRLIGENATNDTNESLRARDERVRNEEHEYDPFDGGKDTNIAMLITQMRIYDTLLAVLSHLDDEECENLMAIHAAGKLVGSLPGISLD